MGSSPTAAIFFGIPLGDEEVDGDELETSFVTTQGLNGDDWEIRSNAMKEADLEIVYDGSLSDGNVRCYLAVSSSLQSGSWDEPTKIDVNKFKIQPDWEGKIRKFCEALEIDFVPPTFLMAVSFG